MAWKAFFSPQLELVYLPKSRGEGLELRRYLGPLQEGVRWLS